MENFRKWPNIYGKASHNIKKNCGEKLNKVRLLVKCETWKMFDGMWWVRWNMVMVWGVTIKKGEWISLALEKWGKKEGVEKTKSRQTESDYNNNIRL